MYDGSMTVPKGFCNLDIENPKTGTNRHMEFMVIDSKKKPFVLSQLLTNALSEIQPDVKAKNLEIRYDKNLKIHDEYLADPIRINQIVRNLLFNAVKYTSAGFIKVDVHGICVEVYLLRDRCEYEY